MNDTFKRDLLKLKPFENFSHLPMSDTFFLWGSLVLECMLKLCWDKIYQKLPNVISSYYIILHYHKIVIYTVKVIENVLISIKPYQVWIYQLYTTQEQRLIKFIIFNVQYLIISFIINAHINQYTLIAAIITLKLIIIIHFDTINAIFLRLCRSCS